MLKRFTAHKEKKITVRLSYVECGLIQNNMKCYPELKKKVYLAQEKTFRHSTWSLFKNRIHNKMFLNAFKLVLPWNIVARNKAAHKHALDIWDKTHPEYAEKC